MRADKVQKIIIGILLLAYFVSILLFKYSNAQGSAKQIVLGGTTIFSFTFHTNFSIFILLALAFFSLNKFCHSIFNSQLLPGLLFFFSSIFCIVMPAHFITTQSDGSEMREYLFLYEIKKCEIEDNWISQQISEGYDKKFHYNSDYPCFRYCDSFFVRHYQVGKNKTFNVFNGIGPLLNLEDEDFYKN